MNKYIVVWYDDDFEMLYVKNPEVEACIPVKINVKALDHIDDWKYVVYTSPRVGRSEFKRVQWTSRTLTNVDTVKTYNNRTLIVDDLQDITDELIQGEINHIERKIARDNERLIELRVVRGML